MKQKVMIVRVVVRENNSKKGMVIEQKTKGNWNVLEEIGVFETLKQRANNKLKKLFDNQDKH